METSCRACAAETAHCHGTLIRHWSGRPECTEDGCESPELTLHAFDIDCVAVSCGCDQPIGSGARWVSSA
ncbi:hypothetical protein MU0050_000109 [[Mycobacterium] wendilense]|uniref:Uncharacterized protein n=1 Tax=[Mycobacterium] wendilense TaxID=3064284 RepID=A0ABM9M837_9MYCO|nr:hypothetical protein [Mycolicibacterium sp. MU0050]CAJ1578534.1 hypothetical protein MU0050_000109 [Mycolicibacterium sp. MU0050]